VRFISIIWKWLTGRKGASDMAPHQRWPEILHWKVGDVFERTYNLTHSRYKLIAVEEDGYAIVDYFGERDWVPIGRLVGHNVSLRTRRVNADIQNSTEYMELIRQFNVAFKELQERDRRNGIQSG
jgi:hypothetical protein